MPRLVLLLRRELEGVLACAFVPLAHTHTPPPPSSTTSHSSTSQQLSFFKQLKLKLVAAGVPPYDEVAAKASLDAFIASSGGDPPSGERGECLS